MSKILLVDTCSVHHSLMAMGKELQYKEYIDILEHQNAFIDCFSEIVFFVNENATSFIKYLEKNFPLSTTVTKLPVRKKLADKRVWYLSMAVDIALLISGTSHFAYSLGEESIQVLEEDYLIISTDIELEPVLKMFPKNITLYGRGVPAALRKHVPHFDIPDNFLKDRSKEDALPNVSA